MIHIFSLSQKCQLLACYSPPPPFTRLFPLILKEGGGSRLLVWKNLLLAVCPEVRQEYYTTEPEAQPSCVLRVFNLSQIEAKEEGVVNLESVWSYVVDEVRLKQPSSYMASDQKGPNVVMSFSRGNGDRLDQQIIILSLKDENTVRDSVRVFYEGFGGLTKVPM